MGFDNSKSLIKPVYFDNLDEIFDEKGSTFLTMRRTQWCKEGEEPDRNRSKLELRKYRVVAEGERADKGFAFLTDDGPNELVNVLIDNGFGNTKNIIRKLAHREDFKESVETLYDKENISTEGEYFDMRTILLNESNGDDEDGE